MLSQTVQSSAEPTTEKTTQVKSISIADDANYSNQDRDKDGLGQPIAMSEEFSREQNGTCFARLDLAVLSVLKFTLVGWLGSAVGVDGLSKCHVFYFRFFWSMFLLWRLPQLLFRIFPDIALINLPNNPNGIIRDSIRIIVSFWMVFHVNYTVKQSQRGFSSICEQLAMHFRTCTENCAIRKSCLLFLMLCGLGTNLYAIVVSFSLLFAEPEKFTHWNRLLGQFFYSLAICAYEYWLVSVAWLNHMTVQKLWNQLPDVQEAVEVRSIKNNENNENNESAAVQSEMNVAKWFEIYTTVWKQKNMKEPKTIDDLSRSKHKNRKNRKNRHKHAKNKAKYIDWVDENYPAFGGKFYDIGVVMGATGSLVDLWFLTSRVLSGEPFSVWSSMGYVAFVLSFGFFLCETTRCFQDMLTYMERLAVAQPNVEAWTYCGTIKTLMQKEDLKGSIFGIPVGWSRLIRVSIVFVVSRLVALLLEDLY